MENASFAAQAVANGPMTAAPASMEGHGWLMVLNLGEMTVVALVAAMVFGKMAWDLWTDRGRGPLVRVLRVQIGIAAFGMMIRTGVEALTLWGWDPHKPVETGRYLFIKRLLDPIGAGCYLAALCLTIMTIDALITALERKPYPDRLISDLPKLYRPAALAVLSFVAAIGVVSTR